MPKPKKKIDTPPASSYEITLTLNDKVLTGSGNSLLEALQAINVPIKIVTKGILHATDGVKSMEAVLTVPRVKRLFYKTSQPLLAKQFTYLLR